MSAFPKLIFACPMPWTAFHGDRETRFCAKCGHSVTNLSEANDEARKAFLATAAEKGMCVTYYLRLSGQFVTPENPLKGDERSKIKQLGVVALSAGALALAAGCVSSQPQKKEVPNPQAQTSSDDSNEVSQVVGIPAFTLPPKK
jgi:hypothetical protein